MTEFEPLAGKVCLVTGATRGIGKGIALQLGQNGATVYITGIACNLVHNKYKCTLKYCLPNVVVMGLLCGICLRIK